MSGNNVLVCCMYVDSCVLRQFCPVLKGAFYYKTVQRYESGTSVISPLVNMEAMIRSALLSFCLN